ncbi:MAG: universal stress protein [Pseudomonadota bacterium]
MSDSEFLPVWKKYPGAAGTMIKAQDTLDSLKKERFRMEKGYQNILCPIDFQANSIMAMKRAVAMVKASGAKLTLAHIINNPLSDLYSEKILNAWGTQEEIEKACTDKPFSYLPTVLLEVVKVMVREFAEKHLPGFPYEVYIDINEHTYRAINEYAEANAIDLIVMATHGRTGPKRLYFGSVAENIVRRAPCSVLIVRP